MALYPLVGTLASIAIADTCIPGYLGVTRRLLMIGVYAGAFLVASVLVQGWTYEMINYTTVFVVVIGMVLESEVISLPKQFRAVINRNKDINVI